jgi:hypothetical protein
MDYSINSTTQSATHQEKTISLELNIVKGTNYNIVKGTNYKLLKLQIHIKSIQLQIHIKSIQ